MTKEEFKNEMLKKGITIMDSKRIYNIFGFGHVIYYRLGESENIKKDTFFSCELGDIVEKIEPLTKNEL